MIGLALIVFYITTFGWSFDAPTWLTIRLFVCTLWLLLFSGYGYGSPAEQLPNLIAELLCYGEWATVVVAYLYNDPRFSGGK